MVIMSQQIQDFKDKGGRWVKSHTQNGVQYITRSASIFGAMKQRCRPNGAYISKYPTYRGCYLGDSFKCFQDFTNWFTSQIGYAKEGYQIDKDFLFAGNKEYSSEKCILIPFQLNSFLCNSDAIRGQYPAGVTRHSDLKKFTAQIKIDGELQYLGTFATVDEARAKYVTSKEAEAKRWLQRLLDKEFEVDTRIISALSNWVCKES